MSTVFFEKALANSVKIRVAEIAAEEVQKAQENISRKVMGEIDKLALTILKEYDVRYSGDNIVITVRKLEVKDNDN